MSLFEGKISLPQKARVMFVFLAEHPVLTSHEVKTYLNDLNPKSVETVLGLCIKEGWLRFSSHNYSITATGRRLWTKVFDKEFLS